MFGSLVRRRYFKKVLSSDLLSNERGDVLVSLTLIASLTFVVAYSIISSGALHKPTIEIAISSALLNAIMESPVVTETDMEGMPRISSDIPLRRSELTKVSRTVYLALLDVNKAPSSFEVCSDVYNASPDLGCLPQKLNDGRDHRGLNCSVNNNACAGEITNLISVTGCNQSKFFVCAQIREFKNLLPVQDRVALVTPGSKQAPLTFTPPSGPSCTNSILDGDESGIDCGGSCPACPSVPDYSDPTPFNPTSSTGGVTQSGDPWNLGF